MKLKFITVLALGFIFSACANSGSSSSETPAEPTANAAPAAAPVPTDPQIAQILLTANNIDIEHGQLAQKKTKNADIKKFAKQMVTDHKAVNKMTTNLTTKLKVKPEDSEWSKALQEQAKASADTLKGLTGKDFDKAYVAREIAFHQGILDSLDKTIMPAAQNPELKAFIEKVRPNIQGHLEHVEQIQAKMK